jgi:hypothetical protein
MRDQVKEIWFSGWTNHFDISRYDQHVRSWTISGYGPERTGVDFKAGLQAGSGWDFLLSRYLGPEISIGDLNPQLTGDDILIWRLDDPSGVQVWSNSGGVAQMIASRNY